jgi:hypothetical protein
VVRCCDKFRARTQERQTIVSLREETMKDTADPQISEQVNALSKKYDDAINNNDAVAVAALYTEDFS